MLTSKNCECNMVPLRYPLYFAVYVLMVTCLTMTKIRTETYSSTCEENLIVKINLYQTEQMFVQFLEGVALHFALLVFRVFISSGFPEGATFGRLADFDLASSTQSLVQKLRIIFFLLAQYLRKQADEEASGFHFRNTVLFFVFGILDDGQRPEKSSTRETSSHVSFFYQSALPPFSKLSPALSHVLCSDRSHCFEIPRGLSGYCLFIHSLSY